MKQLFIMALLFLAGTAVAKSNEVSVEKGKIKDKRAITEFNELKVNGPFEVILVSNKDNNSVSLEGNEDVVSKITTEIKNGVLEISLPQNFDYKSSKKHSVTIKVPYYTSLQKIYMIGSGSVTSRNTISSNVKLYLEGSGSISLNLNTARNEACVLGSGKIMLTGNVQDFECKVIGSGNIDARNLQSSNVEVLVSGSGNADVVSNKAIKGIISGTGNVAYAGNPKEQDLKRSGQGEYRLTSF